MKYSLSEKDFHERLWNPMGALISFHDKFSTIFTSTEDLQVCVKDRNDVRESFSFVYHICQASLYLVLREREREREKEKEKNERQEKQSRNTRRLLWSSSTSTTTIRDCFLPFPLSKRATFGEETTLPRDTKAKSIHGAATPWWKRASKPPLNT